MGVSIYMANWTKESATARLAELIAEIEELPKDRPFTAQHNRWSMNTIDFLQDIFGKNSKYYASFRQFTWQELSTRYISGGMNINQAVDRMNTEAYITQLKSARGFLQAALDKLTRSDDIASVYEGKNTGPESSNIVRIQTLAQNDLRKTIRSVPQREKEVQDAFENLLIGAGIEYTREGENIEYSVKFYNPDFTFKKLDLAVEIKLCNRRDREKELISELNDDIAGYKAKFGNILFVVYDAGGFMRDVDRFKGSFESHNNVIVVVVKH